MAVEKRHTNIEWITLVATVRCSDILYKSLFHHNHGSNITKVN